MTPYRPVAFGRPAPSPRARLGQTFDQMMGWHPATGDLIRLAFHGSSAYLGLYVAVHAKGFVSYLGWILGVGQGLGAVLDIVSLMKRALGTHPPEAAQEAPR